MKFIGESKPVKELVNLIERVAPTKSNVLVIGESGTGKELVARMLHDLSPLKGRPFVAVNCGAIPENLIESELFGHKKGSFTGAVGEKPGLFEVANGGTLFLDEVGDLPLGMQVKLLRAIQDRSFRKVGGTESIRVDVRIIAATNRDLEAAVNKGTFREDLYYRLNVILLKTPSLRERKGDVKILAQHFLKKFSEKLKKSAENFDADAMSALEAYHWPGNVRELENVVERAITLNVKGKISKKALPVMVQNADESVAPEPVSKAKNKAENEIRLPAPEFSKGKIDLDKILGEVEKIYLNAALEHAGGVKKKAASLLGITFRSIRYRLNKLGVDSE